MRCATTRSQGRSLLGVRVRRDAGSTLAARSPVDKEGARLAGGGSTRLRREHRVKGRVGERQVLHRALLHVEALLDRLRDHALVRFDAHDRADVAAQLGEVVARAAARVEQRKIGHAQPPRRRVRRESAAQDVEPDRRAEVVVPTTTRWENARDQTSSCGSKARPLRPDEVDLATRRTAPSRRGTT